MESLVQTEEPGLQASGTDKQATACLQQTQMKASGLLSDPQRHRYRYPQTWVLTSCKSTSAQPRSQCTACPEPPAGSSSTLRTGLR